jgi:hypothetical protein
VQDSHSQLMLTRNQLKSSDRESSDSEEGFDSVDQHTTTTVMYQDELPLFLLPSATDACDTILTPPSPDAQQSDLLHLHHHGLGIGCQCHASSDVSASTLAFTHMFALGLDETSTPLLQDHRPDSPSDAEWEAYMYWLVDVVHATNREIHDARAHKLNAQFCIFVALYRFGIPIHQISEEYLATKRAWETKRRRVWSSATVFYIPRIPLDGFDGRSTMGNKFSCSWWMKPNAPSIPIKLSFLRRYPIVRLYHRLQTTAIDPAPRNADLGTLEQVLRDHVADSSLLLSNVITKMHPAHNLARCLRIGSASPNNNNNSSHNKHAIDTDNKSLLHKHANHMDEIDEISDGDDVVSVGCTDANCIIL